MLRNLIIAGIVNLLFLTTAFAAEQDRVMQILFIAKEIDATDAQVAEAVADGITPKEFVAQVMGRIRLVAPDKAPKGSPVQIAVEGMPAEATELWRRHPQMPTDVWLELYDRNQSPVNIFWSQEEGPRTFELIVAENGPKVPVLEIASHKIQYGKNLNPEPLPIPEPPPTLQQKVQPIIDLMADNNSLVAGDLLNLAEFYFDFADIVRRDNGVIIENTLIFRNTYIKAGALMFQQTGMLGRYSGLSEIVDGIISDYIGLDVIPLNATKTADILNAVAWAFYQSLEGE
ncbi:MAG: hypothetical protein U9N61_09510 [Euryarchaeota archaeon]|nr:hypothetical protein [Euryarchaeota archaeon]